MSFKKHPIYGLYSDKHGCIWADVTGADPIHQGQMRYQLAVSYRDARPFVQFYHKRLCIRKAVARIVYECEHQCILDPIQLVVAVDYDKTNTHINNLMLTKRGSPEFKVYMKARYISKPWKKPKKKEKANDCSQRR